MMIREPSCETVVGATPSDAEVGAIAAWVHRARTAPPSPLRDDALAEWSVSPEADDERVLAAIARLEREHAGSGVSERRATAGRVGRRLLESSGSGGFRAAVAALLILMRGSRWT